MTSRAAKAELTANQWVLLGRMCREASATLHRLGEGLLLTEPVAVYDRWARVRNAIDYRTLCLFDRCEDRGIRRNDAGQTEPGADEYRWDYGWRRPKSIRKVPLTRAEWVAVGDDVKRCVQLIGEIATMLERDPDRSLCKPWHALGRRIGPLRSALDDTVCRQHRDWDGAMEAFYGDPYANNAQLQEEVPAAEVADAKAGTPPAAFPGHLTSRPGDFR